MKTYVHSSTVLLMQLFSNILFTKIIPFYYYYKMVILYIYLFIGETLVLNKVTAFLTLKSESRAFENP